MNKIFSIVVCVLLCVACLFGCVNDNQHPSNQITSNVTHTEQTQKETAPQENKTTNPTIEETIPEIKEPTMEITPLNELDDADLVYIEDYLPGVIVDLRYASTNNFTGKQIYDSNMRPQIRVGTMKKLIAVQEKLRAAELCLVIWDAYRPISAQYKLWEAYPDPTYVANPNNGYSSHSKGNTVDITLARLDGTMVVMPTDFDDFSKDADRDYSDIQETNPAAMLNAQFLEVIMKECGFTPYSAEWWHFSDITDYDVIMEEG